MEHRLAQSKKEGPEEGDTSESGQELAVAILATSWPPDCGRSEAPISGGSAISGTLAAVKPLG